MEEAVKLCPFCGGDGILNAVYSRRLQSYFVLVKCEICTSEGKMYRSDCDPEDADWSNYACIEAIRAWNMRYTGDC